MGALGSAASPLAVYCESRAAVNTRIPAGACEHGGIARSGQAHGRLSGTPPPPQPPPPPPPPLPPQPAAARAQQPWPKTTGTGACGELEEKEVARPHPGPPPQAPPRRSRGSEVTRAPPPVSMSSILRVGAALPRNPAGPQAVLEQDLGGSGLPGCQVPPPPRVSHNALGGSFGASLTLAPPWAPVLGAEDGKCCGC